MPHNELEDADIELPARECGENDIRQPVPDTFIVPTVCGYAPSMGA